MKIVTLWEWIRETKYLTKSELDKYSKTHEIIKGKVKENEITIVDCETIRDLRRRGFYHEARLAVEAYQENKKQNTTTLRRLLQNEVTRKRCFMNRLKGKPYPVRKYQIFMGRYRMSGAGCPVYISINLDRDGELVDVI